MITRCGLRFYYRKESDSNGTDVPYANKGGGDYAFGLVCFYLLDDFDPEITVRGTSV